MVKDLKIVRDNFSGEVYEVIGLSTCNVAKDELKERIQNFPSGKKIKDFFPGPDNENLIELV